MAKNDTIVTNFSSRLKNKIKQRKLNLLLELKKLTSGLPKNLEQSKGLLNLENLISHCLITWLRSYQNILGHQILWRVLPKSDLF